MNAPSRAPKPTIGFLHLHSSPVKIGYLFVPDSFPRPRSLNSTTGPFAFNTNISWPWYSFTRCRPLCTPAFGFPSPSNRPGDNRISYSQTSRAITIVISLYAKLFPTQARGPRPNGQNTLLASAIDSGVPICRMGSALASDDTGWRSRFSLTTHRSGINFHGCG